MWVRIAIFIGLCAFDIGVFALIHAGLPDTDPLARNFPQLTHQKCEVQPRFIPLRDISEPLYRAVLLLEDSRFWEHRGFDFFEIKTAVKQSLKSGRRLRGASTLTQQLAKNLYLTSERSFLRKFVEALITLKLEASLSKRRILELYLNVIDWGRCTIGIEMATRTYFLKKPKDLTLKEAVFLAAIIPNPARFSQFTPDEVPKEFTHSQMIRALNNLYKNNYISLDDFQRALLEPIDF